MSMNTRTPSSGSQVREAAAGVAQTAKQEASHVASTAADNAKQIASEATTQAIAVVQQTKEQVTNLLDQTLQEVRQTAQHKGEQAATGLRTLADQLSALANGQPDQAGQLQRYVQEAQDRVSSFATRLENDGPQAVLGDVADFARRRPAVFLMMAAGAGFAIGRLLRSGAEASSEQTGADSETLPAPNGDASPLVELESPIAAAEVTVLTAEPTWQPPTHPPTPIPGWAGETARPDSAGDEF
jgi:hypothetical protein